MGRPGAGSGLRGAGRLGRACPADRVHACGGGRPARGRAAMACARGAAGGRRGRHRLGPLGVAAAGVLAVLRRCRGADRRRRRAGAGSVCRRHRPARTPRRRRRRRPAANAGGDDGGTRPLDAAVLPAGVARGLRGESGRHPLRHPRRHPAVAARCASGACVGHRRAGGAGAVVGAGGDGGLVLGGVGGGRAGLPVVRRRPAWRGAGGAAPAVDAAWVGAAPAAADGGTRGRPACPRPLRGGDARRGGRAEPRSCARGGTSCCSTPVLSTHRRPTLASVCCFRCCVAVARRRSTCWC